MFNGSISYTTNIQFFADSRRYGFFPIALVESRQELKDVGVLDQTIPLASILQPSCDAVGAYLDGNMEYFLQLYRHQLRERDCEEFMMIILFAAIMKDQQVLIYVNQEEMNMYPSILFEWLAITFGYLVGYNPGGSLNAWESSGDRFDMRFYAVVIDKFYEYNFINGYQFIDLYPADMLISPAAINLLNIEFNPVLPNTSPEAFQMYWKEVIRQDKLKKANKQYGDNQKPLTRMYVRNRR